MRHFLVSAYFDGSWTSWSGTTIHLSAERLVIKFLFFPLERIAIRDIERVSPARLGPWQGLYLQYKKYGRSRAVTLAAPLLTKRMMARLRELQIPVHGDLY